MTTNCYLRSKTSPELQFTRYLYEKTEVKIALIISLLNRKEECLFWAYELFHSGFLLELIELFWNIYYDFYASLNPTFEKYLTNKIQLLINNTKKKDKVVAIIVNNFMIRPYTLDVFFMRQFIKQFDFDRTYIMDYKNSGDYEKAKNEIISMLEIEDYLMLSTLIFDEIYESHLLETLETILDFFTDLGPKYNKQLILAGFQKIVDSTSIFKRHILYSKVIHYFTLKKKKPMGKKLYLQVEDDELLLYDNINFDCKDNENDNRSLPPHKILALVRLHYIDKDNYLSLFQLKREKLNITDAFRTNWLYHASFSPLWEKRILEHNGIIDDLNKTVTFSDDDTELFHDKYGYEPDEQKLEVQLKSIQEIESVRTWLSFYKQHNNGIIEIDDDYFNDVKKINYFD
uniref:Uncharacterized protein n=1 Tax=viral metagenome TaxID=1070528 RepID=A0A6C0ER36_9ZZZZ